MRPLMHMQMQAKKQTKSYAVLHFRWFGVRGNVEGAIVSVSEKRCEWVACVELDEVGER